ncbi:MAG TPA: HPr(Ser) kinase/phosphatase [Rhabdochlamydiaceae bacterium]|nr:HPr(Ser) kinase/phosphatase [Rhabdochlamydiaceae bacterium]
MVLVEEFFKRYQHLLDLKQITGAQGLQRRIKRPELQRPGLVLAGYFKNFVRERMLLFGNMEILYLKDLNINVRTERLKAILTKELPAVIAAGRHQPPKELIALCEERHIPLFRTSKPTMDVFSKMTILLGEEFSPHTTCHGTFIEAFGVGVLIQGDSSIGKSESALGLIERGHRLISDDVVRVKLRKNDFLEGSGPELTRHMMEIRGIGIINVAHLYGAVCVRDAKRLDIIVKLEEWNSQFFYDRIGLDEKYFSLLGVNLPYYILPVKPGRDVVLLIETIVLNHRLKEMGYNSAKEFNVKLLETISKKVSPRKRNIKSETPAESKN